MLCTTEPPQKHTVLVACNKTLSHSAVTAPPIRTTSCTSMLYYCLVYNPLLSHNRQCKSQVSCAHLLVPLVLANIHITLWQKQRVPCSTPSPSNTCLHSYCRHSDDCQYRYLIQKQALVAKHRMSTAHTGFLRSGRDNDQSASQPAPAKASRACQPNAWP